MNQGKSVLQKLWEKSLILEHAIAEDCVLCVYARGSKGEGAILIGMKHPNGSFTPLARLLTKAEIEDLEPEFEVNVGGLYGENRAALLEVSGPADWTPTWFETTFPITHGLTRAWWEFAEGAAEYLSEKFGKASLAIFGGGPVGEA